MKLLFLKQTSICEPLIAIENDIEEALYKNIPSHQFHSFDFVTGIRNITPTDTSKEGIIKEYYNYLLKNIPNYEYLLLLNGYAVNNFLPGILENLQKAGVKIISWHVDDPYYFDIQEEICSTFDTILTVDKETIPYWQEKVPHVHYLPLAAPTFAPPPPKKQSFDISFIGTPFKGSERVQFIDKEVPFLSQYKTLLAGKSPHETWYSVLQKSTLFQGTVIDAFLSREEALHYYYTSKINLNIHKDSYGHLWDKNRRKLEATSPNERFFYLAGLNVFQLIDDTRDFTISGISKEHIITFSDSTDFQKKVLYYLKYEDERKEIAQNLYNEASKHHTYHNRIEYIKEIIGA